MSFSVGLSSLGKFFRRLTSRKFTNYEKVKVFLEVGNFRSPSSEIEYKYECECHYDSIFEALKSLERTSSGGCSKEYRIELCRLLYIVYSMGATFGINMDECFVNCLYDHNELMCYLINTLPRTQTNCDLLRSRVLKLNRSAYEYGLNHFHKELKEICDDGNYPALDDFLPRFLIHIYSLGISEGYTMDSDFDSVHQSHMSKYFTSIKSVKSVIKKLREEGKDAYFSHSSKYNLYSAFIIDGDNEYPVESPDYHAPELR